MGDSVAENPYIKNLPKRHLVVNDTKAARVEMYNQCTGKCTYCERACSEFCALQHEQGHALAYRLVYTAKDDDFNAKCCWAKLIIELKKGNRSFS